MPEVKANAANKTGVEIVCYVLNGVIATLVHAGVLIFNMEVLAIPSAGIANMLAAMVGIMVSFLGSKYFVFRSHNSSFFSQGIRFFLLYALIALLHGLVLFISSDVLSVGYLYGFVVATMIQISLSYLGNKKFVFA